ncbi:hypothetical protein Glove_232g130 [Diversispora epigaea]|uniref:Uncharacterized protein n=1 Tax=Diversispora epigaea TaxID=1348612 RepID=A0A397IJI6_9GLOM|nr:hypothetical protein Glove_232g130 [Diversispora epigaea]
MCQRMLERRALIKIASLDEVCEAIEGQHLIRKLNERTRLCKVRNCKSESEEFNQRNLKEIPIDQKYKEDHKEALQLCEAAKNLLDNQDLDVETWHEKK